MRRLALAALVPTALGCSGDPPRPPQVGCEGCIVLTGGIVFDGSERGEGAVVVRGEIIEEVVMGEHEVVAGEIVDLRGRTVLPGLFDMHEHSNSAGAPYGYSATSLFIEENLKARLRSGVTSILDLGSTERVIFEMRSRIREHRWVGPNLFAAGPTLTVPGGHPCTAGAPSGGTCVFIETADDAVRELPRLLEREPDVIKVVLEGGTADRPLPRMSAEALAAVSAAASDAGVPIFAHVSKASDVELALDAGIRLFAHVPAEDRIDAALAERMANENAVLVPTLVVYDSLARISTGMLEDLEASDIADDVPSSVLAAFDNPVLLAYMTSPQAKALYARWRENAIANFKTCLEAGVTIAAGTDAGNPGTFHGRAMRRELALYVENGMRPTEALATATRVAADVLGQETLGRIERGAIADLVVVQGDATVNIAALGAVRAVYRAGRPLDLEDLSVRSDASLVTSPVTGLDEGQTCVAFDECGEGLYCGWQNVCAAECAISADCPVGSACFAHGGGGGFCYAGDGCDLLAQDCVNGEACTWLGNGATLCWYAGTSTAGGPCSAAGTCAPGFQCDYATARCVQLCDPAADPSTCPDGQVCRDRSADAGVTIGECR